MARRSATRRRRSKACRMPSFLRQPEATRRPIETRGRGDAGTRAKGRKDNRVLRLLSPRRPGSRVSASPCERELLRRVTVDVDEMNLEIERLAGKQMIGIEGYFIVFDIDDAHGQALARGQFKFQRHADGWRHAFGKRLARHD